MIAFEKLHTSKNTHNKDKGHPILLMVVLIEIHFDKVKRLLWAIQPPRQ